EYILIKETLGPVPAFAIIWMKIIIVYPSSTTISQLIFASYLIEPFFPGCLGQREDLMPLVKLIAACSACILCLLNCLSATWATRVQIVFTVGKILALVVLIITGFVSLGSGKNGLPLSLAYRVYGPTVARILPLFVAASVFGSENGSLFSYGRVMFAAAREGHMPSFMAMIHKTKRTPIFAMLFRLPIVIPVIFLFISLYLTISPFIKAPLESFISVILILAGLPVYYFFIHLKATPKCILRCIDWISFKSQQLLNVRYPISKAEIGS
ncbi:hypothetical protein QZH41_020062, partial [Actinostola sp. cb2023]